MPRHAPSVMVLLIAHLLVPRSAECARAVQVSITVDGRYDDWTEVLTNPVNATRDGEGAVASLRSARRVMLLPVALVGQAVATAALPAFSQLVNEGRREELDRAVGATLRASLALARSLSLEVVGRQFSFRLGEPVGPEGRLN